MRTPLPSGTPAELVHPSDGRAATHGVVLLPDASGLGPLFDSLAQALADDHGWAVAVVELWPGRERLSTHERVGVMGTIDAEAVLSDAVAAADLLGTARTSVLGFCVGGMLTMRAAGTGRFDRAVSFYGMFRVPSHWRAQALRALRPGRRSALARLVRREWSGRAAAMARGDLEPFEVAAGPGACPTLAIVGGRDKWTPAEDVEAARAAGIHVVTYEGADHAFAHDPSRSSHRPDDAAHAWGRAVAFLIE